MLRIPHCLDSRLTDGARLSALCTGHALLSRDIIFCFWYSFLLVAEGTQGLVQPEELGKFTLLGLKPVTFRLVA
jgi:hypothetical protein